MADGPLEEKERGLISERRIGPPLSEGIPPLEILP
jgi:hypothetical protein